MTERGRVSRYKEECRRRRREQEKKKTDERREDAPDDDKKSMVTTRNQYSMRYTYSLARVCARYRRDRRASFGSTAQVANHSVLRPTIFFQSNSPRLENYYYYWYKKTNEWDTFSSGNFCLEKLRVSGATIVVLNRTKRASKRAERLRFQRERKRERLSSLLPFSSSGIIVCKQRTRASATGFRSCTCSPLFFFFLHFPFSSEAAKCSWESK